MSSIAHPTSAAGVRRVNGHRIRLWLTAIGIAASIGAVGLFGADYYLLPLTERALSAKHSWLRPSGTIGLRLGMFGVFLFLCLYMYPLRKKWAWLGRVGKTRNWLDFHVLFGLSAPLVITLHSSLKFQGLAGVAYWLMIAVMLSGVVGRYLYAKIPRSLTSAELSRQELEQIAGELAEALGRQPALSAVKVREVFSLPDAGTVASLSLPAVIFRMMWLDVSLVFRVRRLRRSGMRPIAQLLTLGGLLPSRNRELESAVELARQRARVQAKIVFLGRTNEIFHLWHVVHRPFSYAFATLAIVHIVFMIMLGYY